MKWNKKSLKIPEGIRKLKTDRQQNGQKKKDRHQPAKHYANN